MKDHSDHRTRSIALDWGPLREMKHWERGVGQGVELMTMAPELGRAPNAETSTYGRGTRGCATLSRRAGNIARGGSAPRRNLSLTVAGLPASVTFDGRTCGRLVSVTSTSALVQHVYNVSLNSKSVWERLQLFYCRML